MIDVSAGDGLVAGACTELGEDEGWPGGEGDALKLSDGMMTDSGGA